MFKKNLFFIVLLLVCIMPLKSEAIVLGPSEKAGSASRHYFFMTYPNGSEEVVGDSSIANGPEEKLLYVGRTNEYGEIVLEGWNNQGQLRIIQTVPNGYTTNQEEITVNLSDASTAGFINNKGIINPETGRTIIYVFVICFLAIMVVISLMQRKNNENNLMNSNEENEEEVEKKTKRKNVKKRIKIFIMMIIPICLMAIILSNYIVNAEEKNFVITVKDNKGNVMPNVEIKIYAKPYAVEPGYAVFFDANGGLFFDGTEQMIFRLPREECSYDDFYESLTDKQQRFLNENINGATRENYYLSGRFEMPSTLRNGQRVMLNWEYSERARVLEIHGNGGTYNFFGRELTTVRAYSENPVVYNFSNLNKTFIGLSISDKCSNYNQYGVEVLEEKMTNVLYMCWNDKPDGIYINDQLFIGTKDKCFKNYIVSYIGDDIQFQREVPSTLTFAFDRDPNNNTIKLSYLYPLLENVISLDGETGEVKKESSSDVRMKSSPEIVKPEIVGSMINSFVIRENGEDVLTLNANELECLGSTTLSSRFSSRCSITNIEKLYYLKDYASYIYSNCKKQVPEEKPGEVEGAK